MVTSENDPRTQFERATDAVHEVAETVQTTAKSVAATIDESRQPGGILDQLSRFTREAPLRSLAIAFVAGMFFASRR